MVCVIQNTVQPKPKIIVSVNGITISDTAIAREAQHHPAERADKAWNAAARALVIRELLLQEAQRLGLESEPDLIGDGRRETENEAAIRALFEQEVKTPNPDIDTCRRYYKNHETRFQAPTLYVVSHILFAAPASDPAAYARAFKDASAAIDALEAAPEQFEAMARQCSACSSASEGGLLGQVSAEQITPEFELALAGMAVKSISCEPVATRYGFHIIRLEEKIDGRTLPFEAVAEDIAAYLLESVQRRASAQFVARLISRSAITGVTLAGAKELRVH